MFTKEEVKVLVRNYQSRLELRRILKILGITEAQYKKMQQ